MNKYKSANLRKYKDPVSRIFLNGFLKDTGRLVNSLSVKRILDLGCGEGFVARYLISKNQDLCVEGIDINEEALNMARELCPSAVFRKGDITNLKYPDKSFDLILGIEVLEHLRDSNMIIREAKRISSRYCIFSVPLEPFFKICNFLRGKNIKRWGNPPEHLQGWSLKQFRSLLSKHFDKVKIKITFPWMIAICWSKK